MDWDEARPAPKRDIVVGENLETLSVAELEARLTALAAEMERIRTEVARKKAHTNAADAFFKSR
jgi:uncharacterized small protein (DUF1192 family)